MLAQNVELSNIRYELKFKSILLTNNLTKMRLAFQRSFVNVSKLSCRALSGGPAVYKPSSRAASIVNPIISTPASQPSEDVSDKPKKLPVSFEDVSRALYRIRSGIVRSHCDISQFLSEICECTIYLKKDFTQFTGSFKERGGRNALMLLSPAEKKNGVITASAVIY